MRSSRSATRPSCCGLDLGELLLGAQVDGAEPLALALAGARASARPCRRGRQRIAGVERRRARRRPAGRGSERLLDLAARALRAAPRASSRSSRRTCSSRACGERFERRAPGAVGLGEARLGLGEAVGGVACAAPRPTAVSLRSARRCAANMRRGLVEARALGPRLARCASPRSRSGARPPRCALGSRAPLGRDGLASGGR